MRVRTRESRIRWEDGEVVVLKLSKSQMQADGTT